MASQRLPGKVVRPLAGKPMLRWLLDSLATVDALDEVIVTTSTEPFDDPVEAVAQEAGVAVFRGPQDDVLGRVVQTAAAHGLDAAVRISGDSPLLAPSVVSDVIAVWRWSSCDVVTNVVPRTFPPGQSVELLRIEALHRLDAAARDAADREHVTTFVYRNPAMFSVARITLDPPAADVKMAVDTADEFEAVEGLIRRIGLPWELTLADLIVAARATWDDRHAGRG